MRRVAFGSFLVVVAVTGDRLWTIVEGAPDGDAVAKEL
jgi:hypothetical protein